MIFRPNPRRVLVNTVVGTVLGLVSALSSSAPVMVRAFGSFLVVGVGGYLVTVLRTWIRVDDAAVEVGGIRGVKRFEAGCASVRVIAMPGGLIRESFALHLDRGEDGAEATVALASFAPNDRDEVVRAARRALEAVGDR